MLVTRIITALVLLVFISVVLFVLPARYAEWIIGLLLVIGAWEWAGFLELSSKPVKLVYTAMIAACLALVYFVIPDKTTLILQVACAWWFLAFLWNLRFPTAIPLPVRWICGLLVIVPLYAALILLFRLGVEYLVFTLLIVWVADAGAYFAGKGFGRVKLAPAISPGKTWEGVIGGLLLVGALAVAVAIWRDLNVAVFLPFCLAVAGLSVVGDLTVSMFKRTAGVKDSGSLFPGHGGVLDRIDSVAAAAPLFALGVGWLGLTP
ncbi:MAG: phosphatidate cytidylyltransferase [Gammaproteobacteria bacterium]|nr:phosphatidate cytidylyltransferase [Gammaproteobacteria bacterium]